MFTLSGPVSFKDDYTMLQAVAGAFGMTGLKCLSLSPAPLEWNRPS